MLLKSESLQPSGNAHIFTHCSPSSLERILCVSKDMRSMISRSGIQSLGRMLTLTAVMVNLSRTAQSPDTAESFLRLEVRQC